MGQPESDQGERDIEWCFRNIWENQTDEARELIRLGDSSPVFREILDSPSASEYWLEHGTPEQQYYALRVMDLPWRDKERFRNGCLRVYGHADEEVACYALYGVSTHCTATKNQTLAESLAALAADEGRTLNARAMAAIAALAVMDVLHPYGLLKTDEEKRAVIELALRECGRPAGAAIPRP